MTEVEHVAVWVGLIVGIVSIVLAGVAILFTKVVNDRAERVNDATIKALERIGSDVGQLGDDTRELIKDAWSRMLGSIPAGATAVEDAHSSEQVASGLAAELRTELGVGEHSGETLPPERLTKLEEAIERLKEDVESAMRSQAAAGDAKERFSRILQVVAGLTTQAQEVLRVLVDREHLTRDQYNKLRHSVLARAIDELRRHGLVVPLRGDEGEEVVYWLPGNLVEPVRSALEMMPAPSRSARGAVRGVLDRIGYFEASSPPTAEPK